jgi:hypothetical protein
MMHREYTTHPRHECELLHRLELSFFSAGASTYDIPLLNDFQNIPDKVEAQYTAHAIVLLYRLSISRCYFQIVFIPKRDHG